MMDHLLAGRMGRLAARGAVVLAALFAASAAEAQNVRYISVNGNDSRACSLTQPCKTLARGVARAPAGGEVRLLDSGSFGPGVTIRKSLTVSGDGNTLILTGPVTITGAGPRVVFRGLVFNGGGANPVGVRINNAASVHIVDCEFERFTDDGIFVDVAPTELFITDTIARNNTDGGLDVRGDGATKVTLENFRAENNFDGAYIDNADASVSNSTFSGNSNDGFKQLIGTSNVVRSTAANNGAAGFAVIDSGKLQLDSSVSRGNVYGIFVGEEANTFARISSLSVTDNAIGIQNGGIVATQGNSTVFSNGDDPGDDLEGNGLDPFTPN